MGGVNLVEESRNILAASAGVVLGQLRSCKDGSFLDNSTLASRISAIGMYRLPSSVCFSAQQHICRAHCAYRVSPVHLSVLTHELISQRRLKLESCNFMVQ